MSLPNPIDGYLCCFLSLAIQMLQQIILCICCFIFMYMYLKGTFVKVGLLNQRVNRREILLDLPFHGNCATLHS